jgi:transmembrane sensor
MDQSERRERAAQEAAEWVLRLADQNMTRARRTEYIHWLRESPLHVAEMLRVAHVHTALAHFPHWKDIAPLDVSFPPVTTVELPRSMNRPDNNVAESPRLSVSRRGARVWVTAVTASVVTLGLALAYLTHFGPQTIDTGAGERREVTLADGSVVRISPNATLRVRFTGHERRVLLSRGDALFRVAKDSTKPFLVATDRASVRAVGTEFGIEHQGDSVVVTVEEGRVAVTQEAAAAAPAQTSSPRQIEVSLGADQQVVVPQAGPIGLIRRVDSRRELSWADGRLVFEHDSVADVVRRFNRFNRVQMEVRDPKLAARPVSAVFDASDPEAFIVFLESVANVRVTRPSPDVIVLTSEGPT